MFKYCRRSVMISLVIYSLEEVQLNSRYLKINEDFVVKNIQWITRYITRFDLLSKR